MVLRGGSLSASGICGRGWLEVIRSYMDTTNTDAITNALNDAFLLQLPPGKTGKIERAQKAAKEQGEKPYTTGDGSAGFIWRNQQAS